MGSSAGFWGATGKVGTGSASGFKDTVGMAGCAIGGLGASVLSSCCGVGGLTGFCSGLGVLTNDFSSVSGLSITMTSIGSSAGFACLAHTQLTLNAITTWNTAEPARL